MQCVQKTSASEIRSRDRRYRISIWAESSGATTRRGVRFLRRRGNCWSGFKGDCERSSLDFVRPTLSKQKPRSRRSRIGLIHVFARVGRLRFQQPAFAPGERRLAAAIRGEARFARRQFQTLAPVDISEAPDACGRQLVMERTRSAGAVDLRFIVRLGISRSDWRSASVSHELLTRIQFRS